MEDHEARQDISRLGESHNELAIRVNALTAIAGSLVEENAPDPKRVRMWCHALARQAPGISEQEILEAAEGVLAGLPPNTS